MEPGKRHDRRTDSFLALHNYYIDFKLDSMDDAEVQTFHDCLSMVNQSDKVYPLLAMPCTRKKFHLTLCVPEAEGKLAYIKIVEARVHNEKELARFLPL